MSATSKKSMSGLVGETLLNTIVLDSFGAQIIDVLFFDSEGLIVTPTGGTYSIQYSPNTRTWIDFEGAQFPAHAMGEVGDWQESGYIEQIRAVPFDIVGAVSWEIKYRTHGIGMPSLVSSAVSSNRYFSSVNSVQVSQFDDAVLRGNAASVSQRMTIPANTRMSIKTRKNVNAALSYASASGVFVSYVDGDVSGDLIQLAEGTRLNTLEVFGFQISFEFYDGPATGIIAATEKDRLSEYFVVNGGGVIELENITDTDVDTFFSCGIIGLSEPVTPFMLTPDILLTPTTEMSDYNGAN